MIFYIKLYTDYIKWHLTWGNLGPPIRLGLVGREKIQDKLTVANNHCVMLYYLWSLKGYFQAGDGPGNIIINDTYETYFAEISPLVPPPPPPTL